MTLHDMATRHTGLHHTAHLDPAQHEVTVHRHGPDTLMTQVRCDDLQPGETVAESLARLGYRPTPGREPVFTDLGDGPGDVGGAYVLGVEPLT